MNAYKAMFLIGLYPTVACTPISPAMTKSNQDSLLNLAPQTNIRLCPVPTENPDSAKKWLFRQAMLISTGPIAIDATTNETIPTPLLALKRLAGDDTAYEDLAFSNVTSVKKDEYQTMLKIPMLQAGLEKFSLTFEFTNDAANTNLSYPTVMFTEEGSWQRIIFRVVQGAKACDADAYAGYQPGTLIRGEPALHALENGFDKQRTLFERLFFYLPLEHAEDLSLQRRSVSLFEQLLQDAQPHEKKYAMLLLDFAVKHLVVIERFGRFPDWNRTLGRTHTPEEEDYLQKGGSPF